MKKFTSVILALVIALSVAVTAFAASTYQCPHCFAIVEGEKEYNEHLDVYCPVVGTEAADQAAREELLKNQTCPYEGCNAQFLSTEQYEKHLEVCFFKTEPTLAQKVEQFILDLDLNEATAEVLGLLSKVNISNILLKILDAITGLF